MTDLLKRRIVVALALLMGVFALATSRTAWRGERQMRASDDAFARGDLEQAVRHASRAATLYVPHAGHVDAAYARLLSVARGAERARDRALAISAFQAIRQSALESRHLWSPRPDELSEANRNLYRLMGGGEPEGALHMGPRPPAGGWVLVMAFGCLLCAAGVLTGIARGITPSGRFVLSRVIWSALVIVIGACCLGLAVLEA